MMCDTMPRLRHFHRFFFVIIFEVKCYLSLTEQQLHSNENSLQTKMNGQEINM